jgi:hypothetical protein
VTPSTVKIMPIQAIPLSRLPHNIQAHNAEIIGKM